MPALNPTLSSAQRISRTLALQKVDRVPLLLALTHHGARELGLSIRNYYARPENVVEGQLRMHRRYGHDALMGFMYAAAEYEAWGGEVQFSEEGPPSAGEPIFRSGEEFARIKHIPKVRDCPGLCRALDVISQLRKKVGTEIPIVGSIVSPFALPLMQMGFESYLELIYFHRELFWRLMDANQTFSLEWGNAQLEAGASALAYVDPLASPRLLPSTIYRATGLPIAQHVLPRLKGPAVFHLGSAQATDAIDMVIQTRAVALSASSLDSLAEMKLRCPLPLVGNLDGIAMTRWTLEEARTAVIQTLSQGAPGGGFVLSDHHGEIPWHVSEDVIATVAETLRTWGQYPLRPDLHA